MTEVINKKSKKKKISEKKEEKANPNRSVMERARLFESRKAMKLPPKPRQPTALLETNRPTTRRQSTTKMLTHEGQTIFVRNSSKRTQSKSMEEMGGDKKTTKNKHKTSHKMTD